MAVEQRYNVISRLAAGGMAEVYIGESKSVQGFKKRVAIKRVLPHLAQNKDFIGMFLDEARLGARLNHANVVSVFDIGAADNTFFIVMEFVDGCNLKKAIEALRAQGRHFPMKEALFLCMETCRGLSYAHELEDEEGNRLELVHRDVSPPNILISKRGEVKVTDFGLAKASTQLEKTDPGVVKGKFSYLSPEAALGEPVDARADVFALGIVLWEMLAGRRLFLGETDYQTVKLVQQANVPSIQRFNTEADSAFEELLGKALAKNPSERYQSARDFGDALAGYLYGRQMKVTSYDIANLVKGVLTSQSSPAEGTQQSIIDKLIQEELLRFTSLDDEVSEVTELSPDDVEGAQPLDAGLFENPADWFSDDDDVANAFDEAASGSNTSSPGWHESGVEGSLLALESDDVVLEPDSQAPAPIAAPAIANLSAMEAAEPAEPKKSSGMAKILIPILVLLAGAGAAVYFMYIKK